MNFQEIDPSVNKLSNTIVGLAIKVHKALGPGLLESSYTECLNYEIENTGSYVEKEKALPLIYNDVKLDVGYRIDLLIDKKLIVEIKAVEAICDIHTAQLLTYMKLSQVRLGLIINFNVLLLKDGVRRLVL